MSAIRIEDLGKRYFVRDERERAKYRALRDVAADLLSAPFRALGASSAVRPAPGREIWALRNLSLEVEPGELLGIVGRNGAGKSTLLKILTGITAPTEGVAEIRGRIGALLEVGTGFHDELTGRENIFVNGAILGMSRREIDRRFDAIVEFAGVEPFIDTIVKRYSSGMYMRLAFAVAAHVEPEILLVDEVLAVGDAEFQKKCIGKMGEVVRSGRTVLFVSHHLRTISSLCERCLWLDQGREVRIGPTADVLPAYLTSSQERASAGEVTPSMHERPPTDLAFRRVVLSDRDGRPIPSIRAGDGLRVGLEIEALAPCRDVHLMVRLETFDGVLVAQLCHSDQPGASPLALSVGRHVARLEIDVPLAPGAFALHLAAKIGSNTWDGRPHPTARVYRALELHVDEITTAGEVVPRTGAVAAPPARWSVERA